MIPKYRKTILETRQALEQQMPARTFEIDWENNRLLSRHVSGVDELNQAIQCTCCIELQDWDIMPEWFGIEVKKYLGQPRPFVKANLERLIKEALSTEDRIYRITDFEMEDLDKAILCTFTVETTEGAFTSEVRIDDV